MATTPRRHKPARRQGENRGGRAAGRRHPRNTNLEEGGGTTGGTDKRPSGEEQPQGTEATRAFAEQDAAGRETQTTRRGGTTRRTAQHSSAHTGEGHKPTPPAKENRQQGNTATQHHRTQDTPKGSGAPRLTTAHSRAAGHAARQEQPRRHTAAENISRQPDQATNSRQPQATTHSTGRRERNNTAPPAGDDADITTPHDKRPPEQRSTAPQERTQPRATTGGQAAATGDSSTGEEPSPTQARHPARGKTKNTPRHRRMTGNSTH